MLWKPMYSKVEKQAKIDKGSYIFCLEMREFFKSMKNNYNNRMLVIQWRIVLYVVEN